MMTNMFKQPLFWCWTFVVVWLGHVIFSLAMASWDGAAISMFGLFGALLVIGAVLSRRRKNLYPSHTESNQRA